MSYTDLYLKFESPEQANAILFNESQVQKFQNIDVIGTIYRPSGNVVNVDGLEVNEVVAIDGYHVNVRSLEQEDVSELSKFAVQVSSPVRTWA